MHMLHLEVIKRNKLISKVFQALPLIQFENATSLIVDAIPFT
jgi:hypothetical protein